MRIPRVCVFCFSSKGYRGSQRPTPAACPSTSTSPSPLFPGCFLFCLLVCYCRHRFIPLLGTNACVNGVGYAVGGGGGSSLACFLTAWCLVLCYRRLVSYNRQLVLCYRWLLCYRGVFLSYQRLAFCTTDGFWCAIDGLYCATDAL